MHRIYYKVDKKIFSSIYFLIFWIYFHKFLIKINETIDLFFKSIKYQNLQNLLDNMGL